MLERNNLYLGDCMELIKQIPDKSVDLIVTDPPYMINHTDAGQTSSLNKRISKAQGELVNADLTFGFDVDILDEMIRVMKVLNLYVWCNGKQIPMYFDYFVKKHKCNFDILCWIKSNPVPAYSNKYMTDKEYCLYFRGKGAYCRPKDYESAKTVWFQPINKKDKDKYHHPTIKPLSIIRTLVENSSREGDLVLDPFIGSGTTAIASLLTYRDYIGFEINEDFYKIAQQRIDEEIEE